MEVRVAEVTVSVVLPTVPPYVALMVVVPVPEALAKPFPVTVATEVFEEVQVALVVTSMLVPSDCVAVALNCWVAPIGRLGFGGVIATTEVTPGKKGQPNSIGP